MKMQQFKKETKAAIIIQTRWRRHKAYSSYMHLQKAAIIFQYSWRRRVACRELENVKIAAREKGLNLPGSESLCGWRQFCNCGHH